MRRWYWAGVVSLVTAVWAGSTPASAQTIDTRSLGQQGYVSTFGDPAETIPTFGQTFIAPGDSLKSFSFRFHVAEDPILFRFHVMAWDNTTNRATGPLLTESFDRLASGDDAYYTFDWTDRPSGGLSLTPGQTYVGFFSTLLLPNQPGTNLGAARTRLLSDSLEEMFVPPGVYSGGQFVLSHATTFNELSTTAWETGHRGHDLDFVAEFSGGETVPEPASALLFLPALAVVGWVRLRRAS